MRVHLSTFYVLILDLWCSWWCWKHLWHLPPPQSPVTLRCTPDSFLYLELANVLWSSAPLARPPQLSLNLPFPKCDTYLFVDSSQNTGIVLLMLMVPSALIPFTKSCIVPIPHLHYLLSILQGLWSCWCVFSCHFHLICKGQFPWYLLTLDFFPTLLPTGSTAEWIVPSSMSLWSFELNLCYNVYPIVF